MFIPQRVKFSARGSAKLQPIIKLVLVKWPSKTRQRSLIGKKKKME